MPGSREVMLGMLANVQVVLLGQVEVVLVFNQICCKGLRMEGAMLLRYLM
jgi:hypothetical protein